MTPFTERTLVLVKPDAVKRALVGDIIMRFERAGLKVIALKMLQPDLEMASNHYPTTDAQLNQMGNKTLDTYAKLGLNPMEHYFKPLVVDADYNKDRQLPFRDTDCGLVVTTSICEFAPVKMDLEPPVEQARKFRIFNEAHPPQFTPIDIFQPPRPLV